jgi:hypothetical protein
MELHISHPQRTANAHLRIEEVWAGIAVVQAWVNHFHRTAVGGVQLAKWQHLVFPNVMEQLFHLSSCLNRAKIRRIVDLNELSFFFLNNIFSFSFDY